MRTWVRTSLCRICTVRRIAYSTDPSQEACAIDFADDTAPTCAIDDTAPTCAIDFADDTALTRPT